MSENETWALTVSDLLDELRDAPLDANVFLQIDQEGNGYNPLRICDVDAIEVNGDIISPSWGADGACVDEETWKKILGRPRCVVLSP